MFILVQHIILHLSTWRRTILKILSKWEVIEKHVQLLTYAVICYASDLLRPHVSWVWSGWLPPPSLRWGGAHTDVSFDSVAKKPDVFWQNWAISGRLTAVYGRCCKHRKRKSSPPSFKWDFPWNIKWRDRERPLTAETVFTFYLHPLGQ